MCAAMHIGHFHPIGVTPQGQDNSLKRTREAPQWTNGLQCKVVIRPC